MSDPSAILIDEAQLVAEEEAIRNYCRRSQKMFIVLRIKRDGFRVYRGQSFCSAHATLSKKQRKHGSWLIAERTPDGVWRVRDAHLTWFSPEAIEQLAQVAGERWYKCFRYAHPANGVPA